MKRDMDLIREIMLQVESWPYYRNSSFGKVDFDLDDQETDYINYHIKLLKEAGFIEIFPMTATFITAVRGLTWEGHEFLDLMKKDKIWNKAKNAMKETGGMAFEVLLKVLVETATKAALGQLQ